jgi:glutaredoxin-related protein
MGWARSKTPQMLHMLYDNVLTTKSSADIRAFVELTNELKKKKDEKSNQFNQINFFNIDDQKFKAIAARYGNDAREITAA